MKHDSLEEQQIGPNRSLNLYNMIYIVIMIFMTFSSYAACILCKNNLILISI